jgi:hypothetical protein
MSVWAGRTDTEQITDVAFTADAAITLGNFRR